MSVQSILRERFFNISNKKIISFCIFDDKKGKDRNYVNGIFINYVLAKKYYPGWICRFYIDVSMDIELVNRIHNITDVEYMYLETDMNLMCLRFLVFDDPNVDIWICRDLDSILNIRERDAVYEWIQRDESIHIMHDCGQHKGFRVLAGMFGAKNRFKESIDDFFQNYMVENKISRDNMNKYGFDCTILNSYIEKHYKEDYIQHFSDGYKRENSIEFKSKSHLSKFVGFPFKLHEEECKRICYIENVDNLTIN